MSVASGASSRYTTRSTLAPPTLPAAAGPPLAFLPSLPRSSSSSAASVAAAPVQRPSLLRQRVLPALRGAAANVAAAWSLLPALLERLEAAECAALLELQRRRRRLPHWLRWVCDRLISTHPMYDASFAGFLAFVWIALHAGWPVMWCMHANVALAILLARNVGGRVPSDVDARIRSRGRVSPSGFPCVELQLTAAMAVATARAFWRPLHVTAVLLLPLTLTALRLYGGTHFPSQLAASLAVGSLSVPALFTMAAVAFPKGFLSSSHFLAAIPVGAIYVGYIAYKVETNEMPFLRVPKAEFERVLGDIAMGDDATVTQGFGGRGAGGASARQRFGTNVATQRAAAAAAARQAQSKRVSFAQGAALQPVPASEFANPWGGGVRFPPAGPQPPGDDDDSGFAAGFAGLGGAGVRPPPYPPFGPPNVPFEDESADDRPGGGGLALRGSTYDNLDDDDDDDDPSRPKRDSFYYLMRAAARRRRGKLVNNEAFAFTR